MCSTKQQLKTIFEDINEAALSGYYFDGKEDVAFQLNKPEGKVPKITFEEFNKRCTLCYDSGAFCRAMIGQDLKLSPLLSRFEESARDHFEGLINEIFKSSRFDVMHWNILADELAKDFGSINDSELSWDKRFPLIMENISGKDIISLVEVSESKWFDIKSALSPEYTGVYRCKMGADSKDGCAILWRIRKFSYSSDYCRALSGSQIILTVYLMHRSSGERIAVSSTHLKHTKTEEGEEFRLKQYEIVKTQYPMTGANVILCADLNSEPIYNGSYKPLVYGEVVKRWDDCFAGGRALTNREPTTHKIRVKDGKEEKHVRVEDYILSKKTNNIKLIDVEMSQAEGPLPTPEFPSDHQYLVATFSTE